MFNKIIKNEQGSTLLYVVLTCLGLTTIGFAVMNTTYNGAKSSIIVENSIKNSLSISSKKNQIEADIKVIYSDCLDDTYIKLLNDGTHFSDFEQKFYDDFKDLFVDNLPRNTSFEEHIEDENIIILSTSASDENIIVKLPILEGTREENFYLYDYLTWEGGE